MSSQGLASDRKRPAKPWEQDQRTTAITAKDAGNLAKPWEKPVRRQEDLSSLAAQNAHQALRPWERSGTGYGPIASPRMNSYSPYSYPSGDSYLTRPYNIGMNGRNYNFGAGYGMYGNAGMYSTAYGPYPNLGGYQDSLYTRQYPGQFSSMGGSPGGFMPPNNPDGVQRYGGYSSAWEAMLGGIGGIVHFFGRLSFLVDENAHAIHFFMTALLQLLDRIGYLYGELARFVLRILGLRTKPGSCPKRQA